MSWYVSITGKSSKLGEIVKQRFENTGSCPEGTAEEAAKNALGAVAEQLCKSLISDMAVTITAQGSACNDAGGAHSQLCEFKLSTHNEFIE